MGQNFEGLYAALLSQPLLCPPRLYLPTLLPSPENGVAYGSGQEVRGSKVLPTWKGEWEKPTFPAFNLTPCQKGNRGQREFQQLEGPEPVCSLHWGWEGVPIALLSGLLLFPDLLSSPPLTFSPCTPHSSSRLLDLLAPDTSASAK